MTIEINLMCVNYNKHASIQTASYSTTIPASIDVKYAEQLITQIIDSKHFAGTLDSITKNVLQDCYCFSVKNIKNKTINDNLTIQIN